jgi:hypothetical protein
MSFFNLIQTVCVKPQQEYRDINTNVEFAATSPVASNDYYFKTRAGYGKSAGFLGPNYFYRYLMEEIIFPF